MSKVAIVYWSGSGNTKKMASFVEKGVRKAGGEAVVFTATDFLAGQVKEFDAIAFGCPSMGDEQLENSEFEPMFAACKAELNGKNIALFGSYGWGDGEWMRNWETDCISIGAKLVCDSVICNEEPDDVAINACEVLGENLAKEN